MNETNCLACGGQLVPMGSLGNREHYRCRDCGIDTSIEITPPPEKRPPCSRAKGWKTTR